MKETLLDKAKKIERKYSRSIPEVNREQTEVVIGFMKKEIGWGQLKEVIPSVIGKSTNFGRLVKVIRDGIEKGWVDIRFIRKKN